MVVLCYPVIIKMTTRLGRRYNSYHRNRARLQSPDLSSNLSEETSCSSYSHADSSVYSWSREREDDREDSYRRSRYYVTRSASPAQRHYQTPGTRSISPTTSSVSNWSTTTTRQFNRAKSFHSMDASSLDTEHPCPDQPASLEEDSDIAKYKSISAQDFRRNILSEERRARATDDEKFFSRSGGRFSPIVGITRNPWISLILCQTQSCDIIV